MAKKSTKELNTSCRCTYKDGYLEDFASIEEASKKTGVSIAAIKIRCNKPGASGKDKITFEWLDEYTRRHYQAKKSKTKGGDWERTVIKDLTEMGFSGLKSSRSESRNLDDSKIDVADTENVLSCYIQCKATVNTPNIEKITSECPITDKPLIIMWKKQNSENIQKEHEYVLMPKSYFYHLLQYEAPNN